MIEGLVVEELRTLVMITMNSQRRHEGIFTFSMSIEHGTFEFEQAGNGQACGEIQKLFEVCLTALNKTTAEAEVN